MQPQTRPTKKTWTVGDKVHAVRELTSSGREDEGDWGVHVVIPEAHTGKVDHVTRTEVRVCWDGPVQVRSIHPLDERGRSEAFAEEFDPAEAMAEGYPPAPSDCRASKHWVRAVSMPRSIEAGPPVEGYLARLEPDEGRMFHWAFIRAESPEAAESLTTGEPECLTTVEHPDSFLIAPFPDYVMGLWSKHIASELSPAELEAVVEQEGILMVTFDRPSRRDKGTPQAIALAKAELARRREKEAAHAAP